MASIKDSLIVLLASFTLSLLLCYVNSELSLKAFLPFFLIAFVFVLMLNLLFKEVDKLDKGRRLKTELITKLGAVAYYKEVGFETGYTLKRVGKNCETIEIKDIFAKIENVLRFGGELQGALLSELDTRGIRLESASHSAGTKDMDFLNKIIDTETSRQDAIAARIDSSIGRYALSNMFISTLLPSFLIFGFVGSMIISQRDISLYVFSIALLVFLPFSYTISNIILTRNLLEQRS